MFVKIRRHNSNLYISTALNNVSLQLSEDSKSGFDNRWRLDNNEIVSVSRPEMSIGVHSNGMLILERKGQSNNKWHYTGASNKQIRNTSNGRCIDNNIGKNRDLFVTPCANRDSYKWFFEYTVPPIETSGYPLGRILNSAIVQFIFKERQLPIQIVNGNNMAFAISPFMDSIGSCNFSLQQIVPTDPIFIIKAANGNYLYMSGGRLNQGPIKLDDISFRFRIIPNGNNLYLLQGLKPGEGFIRTIMDQWGSDNGIYRSDNNNDQWAQIYINVVKQTDYAIYAKQGLANPKWCCGVEFGDDPVATQACADIGYTPASSKCDTWMAGFCKKNLDDPVCACINSILPQPQCLDLKCSNNPRSYKNATMLGDCKTTYVDCKQVYEIGKAGGDVNIDRNTLNQMCGNTIINDQNAGQTTGGSNTQDSTGSNTGNPSFPASWEKETGLSMNMWILIIIGLIILLVLAGVGIAMLVMNKNSLQSISNRSS